MSLVWMFTNPSTKAKVPQPIALKDVHIASPCRSDWAQMSGDDSVRHCAECNLNVYNLSEMSRREAEELIASREGRLCVRFFRRADGTILTRDCPVGFRIMVRKVSRFAGAALSAVMSVSFCVAQTGPNAGSQAKAQNGQNRTGISVLVIDPQGAVVSGVRVSVREEATRKEIAGITRSEGSLQLSLPAAGSYRLEIKLPGFKTYRETLRIAQFQTEQIKAKLEPSGKGAVTIEVGEMGTPLVPITGSTVTTTFSGDMLKAGAHR